ncbi:MAG: helix-turn-helix transcriptional regulator [Ruminococcus sp.]|nr:helix-turn-helix transcriptional regulator [Ruminococcus sp.]
MEPVGEIIRRAMKQKGVTVNELARRVGKAQNTISMALKKSNMSYETFASYMEALGYKIVYTDSEDEVLRDEKHREAPPTKIVIDRVQYDSRTAEPIICAEQTDGLYAELYRKTSREYFIVYFEKGRRGTINPVSEDAARSFLYKYKSSDDIDLLLD